MTTPEPGLPTDLEVHVEVAAYGESTDPAVVLVPSLGRGAEDFADLGQRLARAGFFALCPNPRGIGGSSGPMEGNNVYDWAKDVAVVIAQLPGGSAHAVGHAWGNLVVRALATKAPEAVRSLTLMGAGEDQPGDREARRALARCFELDLPEEERLQAIATAFFAPGNDPRAWRDGWYPEVKTAQLASLAATDPSSFRDGGTADMLVIQGADDRIAPPENGQRLEERLGDRVELVTIPNAGHAMLPEQPVRIADLLVQYFKSFD
jgi:pimeloyl-ACP methyl ester carboxylesterase